jgi:hypothetical protein
MRQNTKQFAQLMLVGICAINLFGCGGGSSGSPGTQVAQVQYSPRPPAVGDERTYQYTESYSDGSTKTYTLRTVVTQLNPGSAPNQQVFDANGNLIETDTVDANHVLSVTTYPSSGTRTCTDSQPRPGFAKPFTVNETFHGNYATNCAPDGLSATIDVTGTFTAAETVSLNGVDYPTLKASITTDGTVNYPISGSTTTFATYTRTDNQVEWEDADLGLVVKNEMARTYTGNPPTIRLVSRSRLLQSYVNK